MTLTKKHIILIIVLLLLIISVVYRMLNPFVQPRVQTLTFTGEKARTVKSVEHEIAKTGQTESLGLVDTYLNRSQVSGRVKTDLFSMYKPPVKKEMHQNIIQPVQEQIEVPVKDPLLEIKDYITSYRVYGSYKSEDTRAVFLGKDKLVLVAKTGDRLDGKYLISDIQDDYIKIKALDLNETIHLDMREFNNE